MHEEQITTPLSGYFDPFDKSAAEREFEVLSNKFYDFVKCGAYQIDVQIKNIPDRYDNPDGSKRQFRLIGRREAPTLVNDTKE